MEHSGHHGEHSSRSQDNICLLNSWTRDCPYRNSTTNLHVLRWLEFTEAYWTRAINNALKKSILKGIRNMTMKPHKRSVRMG
jgi:lipopolysaccharide biosynthesis glycosyltransferase